MLTPTRRRARSGTTLVELTIALTLLGVVLVALGTTMARAEHAGSRLRRRMELDRARHEAVLVLPALLRAVAPAAGDLRPGEARDTSLELRATLAAGVVCGADASRVLLGDPLGGDAAPVPSLRPGDTLWLYDAARDDWLARAVQSAAGASCPSGAAGARVTLVTAGEPPPLLTPAVVTRRARVSLYRGGDGVWQLGFREWNGSTGRFDVVQPVSGPFAGSGTASGIRFRYFDRAGLELPSGTAETERIARIEVVLRSPPREGQRATEADSLIAVLDIRNR